MYVILTGLNSFAILGIFRFGILFEMLSMFITVQSGTSNDFSPTISSFGRYKGVILNYLGKS